MERNTIASNPEHPITYYFIMPGEIKTLLDEIVTDSAQEDYANVLKSVCKQAEDAGSGYGVKVSFHPKSGRFFAVISSKIEYDTFLDKLSQTP